MMYALTCWLYILTCCTYWLYLYTLHCRASTTTSRGPVTRHRTSNVLTNLKNWKLNREKLESHLEHLEHRLEPLEHGNEKFAPQSAFHQIKHYYFLCFLSLIFYSQVDEPGLVVRPMSDLLLFSKKSKKAYSPSSEGWMSYYL